MNREELIKILHATETPDKIAKWLREQYLHFMYRNDQYIKKN